MAATNENLLPTHLQRAQLSAATANGPYGANVTASCRIPTIDALRGVASLAVAWYHYTLYSPGVLKISGTYGWLGVQMFFVISGFIIPFTLFAAGYQTGDLPRFIVKRILRLDPAYFVDIALIVALGYLTQFIPIYRGAPFHVSLLQLSAHLAYANVFLHQQWLNAVFWTLGVEFQYYLVIAIIYPVLTDRRPRVRVAVTIALLIPAFAIHNTQWLPLHLPIFVSGILVFQRQRGFLSKRAFYCLSGTACAATWLTSGAGPAIVAAASATAIHCIQIHNPLLIRLGAISYSLYLVHVPIGGKLINLGMRVTHTVLSWAALLIVATGASVLAAYLLYLYVELPSQRLSSRVKYRRAGASTVSLRAFAACGAAGQ